MARRTRKFRAGAARKLTDTVKNARKRKADVKRAQTYLLRKRQKLVTAGKKKDPAQNKLDKAQEKFDQVMQKFDEAAEVVIAAESAVIIAENAFTYSDRQKNLNKLLEKISSIYFLLSILLQ